MIIVHLGTTQEKIRVEILKNFKTFGRKSRLLTIQVEVDEATWLLTKAHRKISQCMVTETRKIKLSMSSLLKKGAED